MADVTRLDGVQPGRPMHGAPATRLDNSPAGADSAPPTRLDGRVPVAPFLRENLPPNLAQRYAMGRELGRGGEATVWLCTDANGHEVAVKLFQHPPTYRTDFGSAEYRERFRPEFAVQVLERGEDHGVFYEVMEFCRLGTLEDHAERLGGSIGHLDAISVVRLVATALHGLQGSGTASRLVHGDINPRNILVRSNSPLDLVLTDFGLSVDLGQRSRLSNTGKGTLAYSAPGAMRHYTQPDDWWSVGMTMYQMLLGRNYFQHADGRWIGDDRIENELTVRDVALGEVDALPFTDAQKQRWKLLLAGLLTRDRDYRWSFDEIQTWCEGGSPEVHRLIDVSKVPDAQLGMTMPSKTSVPFALAGVGAFLDAHELGVAMAAHPREAARALSGRGRQILVDWLSEEAQTGSRYSELRSYGSQWGPDEAAVYFVSQLAPEEELIYRDHPITRPSELRRLAQSELMSDVVKHLFDSNLLSGLSGGGAPERSEYPMIDANWHDIVQQALAQAREKSVYLSPQQEAHVRSSALLLAASDDAVAERHVASVQKRVADSPVAQESSGWFASLRRGPGR
ncbi:serine/threonine protein kinase [Prescottella agglutinans]|uniref:Serine/threonine protein kinase n=1 Tax=Prescottella agglutinans TaxID=1644129 RepID=A0ABT6ML53_9NOCA|nr:protein kinase [Prescottella agglutinans]MDH6285058.1 serine/threonine protein kinase [Prescottella agglutinans]